MVTSPDTTPYENDRPAVAPTLDDSLALLAATDVLAPLVTPETPERAAYLDSDAALRDCALAYAAAGWPVLPLAGGGKVPVTTNGLHDASTDAAVVADWWRTMPSCNVGVRTGVKFDVIDIDAASGGFESWAAFTDELAGKLPDILAVAYTGRGGRHLLVAPVPGARNGVGLGGKPGLDYRADGGYVVAPPSRLRGYGRYRWVVAPGARLLGGT